ncbi:MAG: FkbM family methyltransferase [Gammaproteobacteria bacterium]
MILLTISGIVVSVNRFQQGNIIRRCSDRIAEIEKAVNYLAKGKLLVWEHEKRGSKVFHKIYNGGRRAEVARALLFLYLLAVRAGAKLLRVRQWRRFRDVLTRCAERTKDFFFIEIGANDGVTQDILHQYIYKYRWRGILVEPVPYYFEKLKCTYEANDQLILENIAISDKDEIRDFYRVREGVSHFPYWSEGLGSFDLNVVLSHRWAMPNISDYIVTEKVKCIALRSLLLKHHVKKIDLLSIDTEGYDYEIIKQIDFDKLSPLVLIYEHKHIKRDERKRCESMLRAHRYALRKQRGNTLAYLPEAIS